MIKACIFDLDGTLLDTLTSIHYQLKGALASRGYREISRDACREFVGNGAALLVRRALASLGEEDERVISEVLREYNAAYDAAPYYLTEAYEGIPELVDALCEKGVVLGVLSNKPHTTVVSLVKRYFGDRITEIRGGCDDIPLKPDPAALFDMLDRLGISPHELAYIGDSGVDMKTGKRVGAALTLGVLWGFRDREELLLDGADAVVNSPAEILKIVASL